MPKSIEVVFQEDSSDCGLACITMIARQFSSRYDLAKLKKLYPTSADGVDLVELLAIAGQVGFRTRAVRSEVRGLSSLKLPLILHWGFNHYVVLLEMKSGKYLVSNPSKGKDWLSEEELSSYFTGIAVEFEGSKTLRKLEPMETISMLDVFRTIPNFGSLSALALSLSILGQMNLFLFPIYLKALLEFSLLPQNTSMLIVIVLFAVPMFIIFTFARYHKKKILDRITADLDVVLANFLNRIVFSTSYEYFMRCTPSIISEHFKDLRQIKSILSRGTIDAVVDLMTILLLAALIIYLDYWLGFLLLTLMFVYIFTVYRIQMYREEPLKQTSLLNTRENVILMDNLRNIQVIKLNNMENCRELMWQTAYRRAADSQDKLDSLMSRTELIGDGLMNGARYLLVAVAGYRFIGGDLTLGTFLAFSLYQAFLTLAVTNLVNRLIGIWDIHNMLQNISRLLLAERDPMIGLGTSSPTDGEVPGPEFQNKLGREFASYKKCERILVCSDVSFKFGPSGRTILHNIDLEVSRGDILAITGASGSGKSTLLRVITGLLPNTSGDIFWYGNSIKQWLRPELVKNVATVMQEDQIFSGTVLQNISHYSPQPDDRRIEEICVASGFADCISRLKMGMYTQLSSAANILSAGEKQRLFLARALYLETDTLILDEFTGNLDTKTEQEIFNNLRSMKKTIIMTAHRESTIEKANQILALDRMATSRR